MQGQILLNGRLDQQEPVQVFFERGLLHEKDELKYVVLDKGIRLVKKENDEYDRKATQELRL